MEKIVYYSILVFIIAFVFFGIIPGVGAFIARSRWRKFRKRMIELSLRPFISYSDISKVEEGSIGEYRFLGTIEAIQGNNRIWVRSGNLSVAVDMERVMVYTLPSFTGIGESASERLDEMIPEEEPRIMPWDQVFSLPEGTNIFVGGTLFYESDIGIFKTTPDSMLLVVIYDGEEETIIKRSIWSGRQRNEYFNQFTLASIIAGSFSLLLAAFIMLHNPVLRIPALFSITLSLFPVAILFPPGVILYFLYRGMWKKGRVLRATRDLLRLPLRYFGQFGPVRSTNYFSDGESSRKEKGDVGNDSLSCFKRFANLPDGSIYVELCGKVVGFERKRKETKLVIECGDSTFETEGDITFRESWRRVADFESVEKLCVYGVYREHEGRKLITASLDPMCELVAIAGNPETEAEECQKRARVYELVSALFISLDLLVNMFLTILFLHNYIV